jgi:UDP-N-acetylmuramyl pentapeptide phosphotransferase/UDP-N-acetylglucosamine-1-phosphate transferase
MELADRLGHVGATVLGIVLAVTPVALWIAWTATLVVCIMLVAVVSAALFVLLTELLQQRARNRSGRESASSVVVLPDEFIEEVHRLFPLTYHHSRLETARFRRAMKRLSALIGESQLR